MNASNQKHFPITGVHRNDLESIGFDTSHVDDDTMRELARKMGKAYTEIVFWIDLPIIADGLEIPKHLKRCAYCRKDKLPKGEYRIDEDGTIACLECWKKYYKEEGEE